MSNSKQFLPAAIIPRQIFADGTYRYMAEFPDFSEWEDVSNKISFDDDSWIGLVAIRDEMWWTGGRQFLGNDFYSHVI